MNDLEKNKAYLETRIQTAKSLYEQGLYEDCINYIEITATFAWLNFSGFYKLQVLEKILVDIGKTIPSFRKKNVFSPGIKSRKNVLHICSNLKTVGGHSKLLFNWIQIDKENDHTILCTRLDLENLRKVASAYSANEPLMLISLEEKSKLKKAEELKKHLSEYHYDYIALHTDPDEVISTLALSDENMETPVLLLNHADHTFWLGSTITDILLQIRESNMDPDIERRNIPDHSLLPIPVKPSVFTKINDPKEQETSKVKILSTGSVYKYTPTDDYNFYEEILLLAKKYPDILIQVVGIKQDSDEASKYRHESIQYLGIQTPEELNKLENEADLFLEGFPLPSFTALLQVSLKKIPFALHYNPLDSMKLFNDNEGQGIHYPKNKEKWREKVSLLIEDPNYRKEIAEQQYNYINTFYSENAWLDLLKQAYKKADSKKHKLNHFTPDIFYNSRNEKTLATVNSFMISHFAYTHKLNFFNKVKVLLAAYPKNKNVKYYLSKQQLIEYFFRTWF